MSFDALIVDNAALNFLDAAMIDEHWFSTFKLPKNSEGLRRIVVGKNVYILSENVDENSPRLVVNVGPGGVLEGTSRARARFERILRVSLRKFDRNITLPAQWQVYHEGSRLSVYADSIASRDRTRIYFEQSAGERDLYAYTVTKSPKPLLEVNPDEQIYRNAIQNFEEAVFADASPDESVGSYGILLNERLGVQLANSGTLEDWLERRLNKDQLTFVHKSFDGPVRLRGAAGTGKTQAMAVKCLHDLYADFEKGENRKTFAFLTHSSALAHEVVRGMLYALDQSDRWSQLKTIDGVQKLWIGTLYERAQEQLSYARKGLMPLSLDGREGREYQRILIEDALRKVTSDPRVMYGILGDEAPFTHRLIMDAARPVLVEELMNEFACVLDAENIRKGTKESQSYLSAARADWQMSLSTEAQRQAVLEIHDTYRALLKAERLMGMDQMIADFGRYLSTHEWEQLKDRDGFDVIFVDEYHYFNRVEAMTLQSLFKPRAEISGRWPLFMAYDLKQSTSDAAISGGIERFKNPGVGASESVDLKENYRSTPQITKFLQDLDGSFPSIDLEGEFETYASTSKQSGGEVPVVRSYNTDIELLDRVFVEASELGRELGGRRVAVLCLNEALFDTYQKASRIQGKFVSVTSREDLKELQWARSRCIFSMPEYVAGLQFDVVFIIHPDQRDLSDVYLSQGARRRYLSRLYLGASRAQRRLVLAVSEARGGKSEILKGPLENGSLIEK